MLIKNWSPTAFKHPNHEGFTKQPTPDQTPPPTIRIPLYWTQPTIPVSEFPSMTPRELNYIFEDQLNAVIKEIKIFKDYKLLNDKASKLTKEFYTNFYVYQPHTNSNNNNTEQYTYTLNKQELLQYMARLHNETNTYLQDQDNPLQKLKPQQEISIQWIRQITWYTTSPFINHINAEKHIPWQETLLTYAHNQDIQEIIVDGSRQMGKSKTTAEILVESSFLPAFHQLVAAPSQDLTNLIKNYIYEYIQPFDQELFIPKAKERCIINYFSGSRIHFLTLKEEWQKALGLTLKRIIIDEAQLVSVPTVIESLKPTMTTTGWQLICIGTAIANTNSYMYQSLMEAKKWLSPTKYITVSADDNPFITPQIRQEILNWLNNPLKKEAYLRQYYNKWGGWEHQLFKPHETTEYENNTDWTIIIANDPARFNDKSAYSVALITEWKIVTVESWQVPETHKKDWTLQRHFMQQVKQRYLNYKKIITVMDWTGIGDWVVTIFEQWNYKIDYVIKYTSSDTTNIDKNSHRTLKVWKSVLINNALDLISENIHEIFTPNTKDLQEELNFLEADYDSMGRVKMKSSFFDDEINAMMLSLYISTKFWIHTRPTKSHTKQDNKSFIEEVKRAYPDQPRRRSQQQHRTNYF